VTVLIQKVDAEGDTWPKWSEVVTAASELQGVLRFWARLQHSCSHVAWRFLIQPWAQQCRSFAERLHTRAAPQYKTVLAKPSQDQWAAKFKQVKLVQKIAVAFADISEAPQSFTVSGFASANADGTYVQSGPPVNNRTAYNKKGNAAQWCCYVASSSHWMMQTAQSKGTNTGTAHTLEGRDPWDAGRKPWSECVKKKWVERTPAVSGGLISQAQQAALQAAAVLDDVKTGKGANEDPGDTGTALEDKANQTLRARVKRVGIENNHRAVRQSHGLKALELTEQIMGMCDEDF